MNILAYTFLLMTLMALVTTARLHQAVDRTVIHEALTANSRTWRAIANAEEYRLFNGWCNNNLKPGPKKGSKQKKDAIYNKLPRLSTIVSEEEPVYPGSGAEDFLLTERLNLASVLTGHHRAPFIRLLQRLYPTLPTESLLEQLDLLFADIEHVPRCTEDLATLEFINTTTQRLWYQLLKGKPGHYPPLFTLVKWDTSTDATLEIFRVPEDLLQALTGDSDITRSIILHRAHLLNGYAQKKQQTNKWELAFEAFISENWPDAPWTKHLSYKISPPDWEAALVVTDAEGAPIHHWESRSTSQARLTQYLLRESH